MLSRTKKMLFALALVFIAPGVLAIIFYLNPSWLGEASMNKGTLLAPPQKLALLPETKEKWHLTVWCPAGCDARCLSLLDEMARVRLALGRRLYQVDLWLLQKEDTAQCTKDVAEMLKTQAIEARYLSAQEQQDLTPFQDEPRVFLADPEQYLILQYEARGAAQDVFQDLKRLLNTREQA